MAVSRAKTVIRINQIKGMTMADPSPEKAGGGGSIPSLATTFSNTYSRSNPSLGSNWFQFQPADIVSCGLLLAFDQTTSATSLFEVVRRIIHLCIRGCFHSTAMCTVPRAAKKAKEAGAASLEVKRAPT
jgi:hypothetical protein